LKLVHIKNPTIFGEKTLQMSLLEYE